MCARAQVLNTAFLIVAFLCSFIGGAGYYMYGTHAADVVIFNLPLVLATLCSSLVLITPPAKFALTMEPVAAAAQQAASGALLGGRPLLGLPRALLRTAVALAILVAARSVPFLAYLMALVGSFMTVSVSVTFPALCHLTLVKGQSAASVSGRLPAGGAPGEGAGTLFTRKWAGRRAQRRGGLGCCVWKARGSSGRRQGACSQGSRDGGVLSHAPRRGCVSCCSLA